MGVYQVTAPDGRKLRLTGDAPPTDADLDEIFAGLPAPETPQPRRMGLFTDPRLDPAASEDLTDDEVATADKARAGGLAVAGTTPFVGPLLKALGNPYVAGGLGGAMEYAHSGDVLSAGKAALANALMSRIGTAATGTKGLLANLAASGAAKAAAPAATVAAEVAPAAYRGIPSLMKIAPAAAEEAAAATEAARATSGAGSIANLLRPAAKAAPVVAEAAPAVVEAAKAAPKAKTVVAFAKEIAKSDPKVGEKIWILLDDAGAPLERLTPDQAAAAARKGLQTTWVKNLW